MFTRNVPARRRSEPARRPFEVLIFTTQGKISYLGHHMSPVCLPFPVNIYVHTIAYQMAVGRRQTVVQGLCSLVGCVLGGMLVSKRQETEEKSSEESVSDRGLYLSETYEIEDETWHREHVMVYVEAHLYGIGARRLFDRDRQKREGVKYWERGHVWGGNPSKNVRKPVKKRKIICHGYCYPKNERSKTK